MPFDPYFKTEKRRAFVLDIGTDNPNESVEKQIGRSDYLLGEITCPFPAGIDQREWQKGFDAEKSKDRPPTGKNETRLLELASAGK